MMLQNETEMYNLGLGGNARYCNGHMQVAASMATKKECKSKKAKMVPSKDDLPSPTSPSLDGRLKFSDRLKALLKSGASGAGTGAFNVAASVKDESVDQPDDPYAFSEPEPQVLHLYQNPNPNHTYSRRCVTLTSKVQQPSASPKSSSGNAVKVMSPSTSNSSDGNIGRLYPALSASLGQLFSSNSLGLDPSVTPQIQPKNIVSAGEKVLDDESSKTMNRLQAKIARNKVIGKHRKVRTSGRSSDMSPHGTSLAASTATSTGKNISGARGLWPPQRERSLLEEQLLGLKPEVLLKKESESPPLSSRHAITYRPQMLNHSSHAVMATIPSKRRRCKVISRQNEVPRHEALQRIQSVQKALREYRQDLYPLGVEVSDSEESDLEEAPVHQRHWFSAFLESGLACERESRLGQIRAELRRRVNQTWRGMPTPQLGPYGRNQHSNVLVEALLDSARMHPSQSALFVQLSQHGQSCHSHMRHNRSKLTMLVKRTCSYRKGEIDACSSLALPCTQHCVRHIMYNVDQLLFEHCTAKFSDNTQCCVPVFDICHELPLCMEHARKRDNYDKMCAEIKPKKVRKKAKPSAMTRPSKRGKKKRRVHRPSEPPSSGSLDVQVDQEEPCEMSVEASSPAESVEPYVKDEAVDNLIMAQEPVKEEHQSLDHHHHNHHQQQQQQVEVEVEEVLAMAEELPLDTAELANQASRLLEEHDLTNVLNQIPADAFNDLFTEDKNGQYEPTREETEELERALEAVDKDVKSLEKLSQTQGLLVDTLMDEHALVQTLAQLPTDVPSVIPAVPGIVPVFATYHHHHHNGYVVNSPHAGAIMAPITHPVVETPSMAPTISIQTQTDMPS